MQSIRLLSALAAGASDPNVLAGNRFEYLPRRAGVVVYGIAHDQGAQTVAAIFDGDVTATLTFGNVILFEDGVVPAAIELRQSDHRVGGGGADGGDRLILAVSNASAAAADVSLVVEIYD